MMECSIFVTLIFVFCILNVHADDADPWTAYNLTIDDESPLIRALRLRTKVCRNYYTFAKRRLAENDTRLSLGVWGSASITEYGENRRPITWEDVAIDENDAIHFDKVEPLWLSSPLWLHAQRRIVTSFVKRTEDVQSRGFHVPFILKSGHTLLMHLFAHLGGSLDSGQQGVTEAEAASMVFAAVAREPRKRFEAAFRALVDRAYALNCTLTPDFLCTTGKMRKSSAYIDFEHTVNAVFSGTLFPGVEQFFTQMYFLSGTYSDLPGRALPLDFLARVEYFVEEWKKLNEHFFESSVDVPVEHLCGWGCTEQFRAGWWAKEVSRLLIWKLCYVYSQDFVCLGYRAPRMCQGIEYWKFVHKQDRLRGWDRRPYPDIVGAQKKVIGEAHALASRCGPGKCARESLKSLLRSARRGTESASDASSGPSLLEPVAWLRAESVSTLPELTLADVAHLEPHPLIDYKLLKRIERRGGITLEHLLPGQLHLVDYEKHVLSLADAHLQVSSVSSERSVHSGARVQIIDHRMYVYPVGLGSNDVTRMDGVLEQIAIMLNKVASAGHRMPDVEFVLGVGSHFSVNHTEILDRIADSPPPIVYVLNRLRPVSAENAADEVAADENRMVDASVQLLVPDERFSVSLGANWPRSREQMTKLFEHYHERFPLAEKTLDVFWRGKPLPLDAFVPERWRQQRRALLVHHAHNDSACDIGLLPLPGIETAEVDYKLWLYSVFGKARQSVPRSEWPKHLALVDTGDTRDTLNFLATNSIVFRNVDMPQSLIDMIASPDVHYVPWSAAKMDEFLERAHAIVMEKHDNILRMVHESHSILYHYFRGDAIEHLWVLLMLHHANLQRFKPTRSALGTEYVACTRLTNRVDCACRQTLQGVWQPCRWQAFDNRCVAHNSSLADVNGFVDLSNFCAMEMLCTELEKTNSFRQHVAYVKLGGWPISAEDRRRVKRIRMRGNVKEVHVIDEVRQLVDLPDDAPYYSTVVCTHVLGEHRHYGATNETEVEDMLTLLRGILKCERRSVLAILFLDGSEHKQIGHAFVRAHLKRHFEEVGDAVDARPEHARTIAASHSSEAMAYRYLIARAPFEC